MQFLTIGLPGKSLRSLLKNEQILSLHTSCLPVLSTLSLTKADWIGYELSKRINTIMTKCPGHYYNLQTHFRRKGLSSILSIVSIVEHLEDHRKMIWTEWRRRYYIESSSWALIRWQWTLVKNTRPFYLGLAGYSASLTTVRLTDLEGSKTTSRFYLLSEGQILEWSGLKNKQNKLPFRC